ncbi:hypothetical protein ACOMHN_011386 [Nucella lapillus]
MKYSRIGATIGHEISHGFDLVGRGYNKDGNPEDWWTNATEAEFKKRETCFVNQYSNFVSPEANKNLNGHASLAENVADAGGIRLSFRAYKNWVKTKNGGVEEKTLPCVGLNVDKLFFLIYAQVKAVRKVPARSSTRRINSFHAQNRFRVIGSLQNSDEFAKAFECSYCSYMTPASKCKIW